MAPILRVTCILRAQVGNLTKGRYSTMLKCPEFWESALTPKILLAARPKP